MAPLQERYGLTNEPRRASWRLFSDPAHNHEQLSRLQRSRNARRGKESGRVRLVVPTTFERSFIEALVDHPVDRIYGSLSSEAGARAKVWLPQGGAQELEAHIADARSRGIGFYYTM